jgi:hypothetical protein
MNKYRIQHNVYKNAVDSLMWDIDKITWASDFKLALAHVADDIIADVYSPIEAHQALHKFVLTYYKVNHPEVQQVLKRIRNMLDILTTKKRGLIQTDKGTIDFLTY